MLSRRSKKKGDPKNLFLSECDVSGMCTQPVYKCIKQAINYIILMVYK